MNFLYILEIILLLMGILVSCEVFTNAVENLGEKLNLGHEFTGSVLAAVGTALPETILPLVAIYLAAQAGGSHAKSEIAIGAILGAPFLLSTLAMFLLGLSIFIYRKSRGTDELKVDTDHLYRDLWFFLKVFVVSILASFSPIDSIIIRPAIAVGLLLLYAYYLYQTYLSSKDSAGEDYDHLPELFLSKYLKLNLSMPTILMQVFLGLIGIIYFAHGFVETVEHVSAMFNMSPLVLSLIISPIATELPEKMNSWIWSSQGKDVLAMGNLSGAMVFQSSIPCAIGILLTPWKLTTVALVCAGLTILSTLVLLATIKLNKTISYKALLGAGSLYIFYLVYIFVFN